MTCGTFSIWKQQTRPPEIYFEKCVLDYKIGKIWLRENPQNWGTPKTWLRSTMSLIRQGAPSPPFDWTKVDWTKIFQNNGWGATLLALKNLHQKPWEKQGGWEVQKGRKYRMKYVIGMIP